MDWCSPSTTSTEGSSSPTINAPMAPVRCPKAAWTGPLSRGDSGVIAAHFAALRGFPREYRNAYDSLNQLAARVLSRDPEDTISQLAKLHNQAKAATAAGRHG